ncbi:hypothetical protein AVEN_17893-1 [Araneus ventricosus]|uniref:Uncharacterized protein n=1 Tax=Araneus ventricosus TaxID=182803 RepID=A0A4Y2I5J5_ARAVE|nr:hypothetical protein AVEN_17893-1 [Araneus ventricosus]
MTLNTEATQMISFALLEVRHLKGVDVINLHHYVYPPGKPEPATHRGNFIPINECPPVDEIIYNHKSHHALLAFGMTACHDFHRAPWPSYRPYYEYSPHKSPIAVLPSFTRGTTSSSEMSLKPHHHYYTFQEA